MMMIGLINAIRDVTKFELKFNNVQTSNVFNRYEIQWMFSALCCRMRICRRILVLQVISSAQRARKCRQTCFLFSNSTYHTNYSYWMCNI